MQKDGQMHENWMKVMGTPRQAVFFCVTRAETAELKRVTQSGQHTLKGKAMAPCLEE